MTTNNSLLTEDNISHTFQSSIALRITTRDAVLFEPFFKKYCHTWAYGKEIGNETEKEHIHAFLITDLKVKTIRDYLIKIYPELKGQKSYSFKEDTSMCNDYNHLCYVCKDQTVIYSNICPNLIKHCKEIGLKKKLNSKKEKQKKPSTIPKWKKCLDDFGKDNITPNKSNIMRFAIGVYKQSGPFAPEQIYKLYNYLCLNLLEGKQQEQFEQDIFEQLNQKYNLHLIYDI